jgi:DHA1 family bicyclomycin/chloramphenicol resistance-like MFS transporter
MEASPLRDRSSQAEPITLRSELPSPETRPPGGRTQLILIVGGLSAVAPLSIDMYLPALPALSHDLGGTASLVQLTLTAFLLGLAAGQLVAGPLSDAFGRRRPLLVGLLAYTVASLLCALAPSVSLLIFLRLIQGSTGAAGIVIARAIVRDHYTGSAAARFFALTMLVNGLAPILAPLIGGQLLRITSWRGVFVVLATLGLAMLAASAAGLAESLPEERRRTGGIFSTLATFVQLATDRVFAGYALTSGLAFAAMFAYISGSPFVLENMYGISPQLFGLFFGINALGIVCASQLSGLLVDRAGPRRLLAVGLGCALTGGVLLLSVVALGGGLAGILPALFLVVASIGLIAPNATALALADHPAVAGSASALLGVLQYVVGGVAAPLVGIGGSGTALPMAAVIAVLTVGAALAFALLARRSDPPGRSTSETL